MANIQEICAFTTLFLAFHTSVEFVKSLSNEQAANSQSLLRKIRLVYLRKRCDFLGGLEKNPLSTFSYFGEKGNCETRTFGRLISLFFLTFDNDYFSSYIPNPMELSKSFHDYIMKMIQTYGFFRNSDRRDRTMYYHFLLSPNTDNEQNLDIGCIMFQKVCHHYHFPHEPERMSSNINNSRNKFVSRWNDHFRKSFSEFIVASHKSIAAVCTNQNPSPSFIQGFSDYELTCDIRSIRAYPKYY